MLTKVFLMAGEKLGVELEDLRSLFGNDSNSMLHWMKTMNYSTKGVSKKTNKN